MKGLSLSVAAFVAMGTYAIAGGDIAPVEPAVEVPAPVVASEGGFYIGGAYSSAHLDEDYSLTETDGYSSTIMYREVGTYEEDYDAIMLQAGYEFNKYFAIEGRYWTSIGDGDWSDKWDVYYYGNVYGYSDSDSGSGNLDFDAWGIYLKPMYPVTEEFTVYGLLGYGNVTLSDNGDDWLDENGFQWGVGASYAITDHLSIFADYVSLLSGNDTSVSYTTSYSTIKYTSTDDIYAINIGLTYKF